MSNLGPLPPLGSDVGSPGEDPRNSKLISSEFGPDEHAENAIELKEVAGLSLSRIVIRRFLRNRAAVVSMVILALVVILSLSSIGLNIGPLQTTGWWHWTYSAIPDPMNGTAPTLTLIPFSIGEHPLGQDSIGHDMFARVMRGTQQSLMILFIAGIVSTVIGAVIGGIAGYFGGVIDALLMRFTDLVIVVPLIILAAIVAHIFTGGGSIVLALILGILSWTSLARLVRGEVLSLREREFVEAAKVAGASDARIIFRHVLPNTVGVIIVSATLLMSATILTETGLSYLGLGVHAPDVSLGLLISQYETSFTTRPWLFWFPATFIVIIALTINFIGDGLRDAFDPRQKRALNRAARKARSEDRPKPVTETVDA